MTRAIDQPDIAHRPTHAPAENAPAALPDAHAAHHENPHLAHHYDTPQQQYDAAKFGMWLFIATEFLLFGGLFCLYAIYRGNNPALFEYGAQYLSTTMGAINTVVLILSSLTIALAVRCAQLNQTRGLVTMLALTVLGGGIFMGIKYVEYSEKFEKNLVWGVAFYEPREKEQTDEGVMVAAADHEQATPAAGDPSVGRTLWMQTCVACHGQRGEGVTGQAFDVRGSEFIASKTNDELLAFIKRGRMPFEKENRTGVQMPPKGGNPLLKDEQLRDIIAYVRTFEPPADATAASEPADGTVADAGSDASATETVDNSSTPKVDFFIPKSSIPPAGEAPRGMATDWEIRAASHALSTHRGHDDFIHPSDDPDSPPNVHLFFGIYFLMTGLHGLHVLAGMVIISALVVLAWMGRYSSSYYTPVEITALYWHVVDVIWIFLFPLLYLIH